MTKIGRNDPCPCGSGKKYKHCCLNTKQEYEEYSPQYFTLKGKQAEDIVHDLAEKTFFTDWCYKNPEFEKGKELCDLLIVFDDVAIIWQVKNLKLGKDGKYKKSEVEKNLRQLVGAKRKLIEHTTTIKLKNPKRGEEDFDPSEIHEIYLISALVGKGEEYFSFLEEFKNLTVHVFNRDFTELVLNELDTISDFIHYLQAKESLVKTDKELLISGGEEELLAFYLLNGRSFQRFDKSNYIFLEEGSWKHLLNKPEYKAKKQADKISYLWDGMIKRAYEAGTKTYEQIARELARLNRFERRYFSKAFADAHIKSHNDSVHDNYRRISVGDGVSFCFLFMDDPEPTNREKRKGLLFAMCHVARGKFPDNKKVIGIATEKRIEPLCSYDFCLYEKPDWTKKDEDSMIKLQKEAGIFEKPEIQRFSEDEYPQTKCEILKT